MNDQAVTEQKAQASPQTPASLQTDSEDVRRWVHGILDAEPGVAGGFLKAFAAAVARSNENYPLLRPAILELKEKYPFYKRVGELL